MTETLATAEWTPASAWAIVEAEARMSRNQRWSDLTTGQRAAIVAGAAVQVALAAAAWVDLARRPAEQVRGPKPLWAVGIAVNFVGPISYFVVGRRR